MATGTLIGESLRIGASLDGVTLTVSHVFRAEAGDEGAGQPRAWTFIEFDVADGEAEGLASALSDALEPAQGWYCDFRTLEDTFVVFAGRAFRYRRGDGPGRAEAEDYARSMGVPVGQIDWPD
jgi:hypothetical protein